MTPRKIAIRQSDFSAQHSFHFQSDRLSAALDHGHFHANAEIGTFLDTPGRMFFDGLEFDLEPGDLYLLDCTVPHGHEPLIDETTDLYVHLKYDALAALSPPGEYAWFMIPFSLVRQKVIPPVVRNCQPIVALLKSASRHYVSRAWPDGYFRAWADLTRAAALLAERLRHLPELQTARRAAEAITPALRFMDSHLEQSVSVEQMAQACCLSESRFAHLFTQVMQTAPIVYRNRLRINRAIELLQTGSANVQEAARTVGFESRAQFRRLFLSQTGCTPQRFLQQNQIHFRQKP